MGAGPGNLDRPGLGISAGGSFASGFRHPRRGAGRDAGVLNESVWAKLVAEKKVDPARVKVIYTTPPYFDYNWTVRGDLDPKLVAKIRRAFLDLDYSNPEHRRILDLQRTRRFIGTTEANYRSIEAAAREAGLIRR